jgi:hypothetical protein
LHPGSTKANTSHDPDNADGWKYPNDMVITEQFPFSKKNDRAVFAKHNFLSKLQ